MSRSQNLRHNVINQVIDDMARGHIPSPLPSQSATGGNVQHQPHHSASYSPAIYANAACLTQVWKRLCYCA